MHDVRNQIYSLKFSIENIVEIIKQNYQICDTSSEKEKDQNLNVDLKKCIYKSQKSGDELNIDNKINPIKRTSMLEQLQYPSKKDNINISKQMDTSQISYNSNANSNLKNQEKKVLKKINYAFKDNKFKIIPNNLERGQINEDNYEQIHNHVLDLDISFDNDSIFKDEDIEIIEEENIDSKDDKEININHDESNRNISESKNDQNMQLSNDIQNLIDYSKSPDEMLNLIKFINFKVNFLQHIDLTFEQNYNMNLILIEPKQILSQISKLLKILFINKSNEINLNINSKVSTIEIDIRMFKYLICYIVNVLHYKKKKQIQLIINFEHKQSIERKCIDQFVKIEARQNSELKPKKLIFSEYQIFNNIIKQIGYNLKYDQINNQGENSHMFNIQYSSKENIDNLEELNFDHTVSIKDDKIILQTESLFVQTEHSFQVKNGLIFLNVDDEINIQSMHTMLFARLDVQLTCCSNGRELVQLLAAIHSWQMKVKDDKEGKVVVLLDHVLDGQQGLQAQKEGREHQIRFGLSVVWVLVSSTEDADTLNRQKREGISYIIQKPLSVAKIREVIGMQGLE